jgi:hypothetical protein
MSSTLDPANPLSGPHMHIGAHEGDWQEIDPQAEDNEKGGGSSDPLSDIRSGLKVFANVGLSLGKSLDEHTTALREYNRRLQRNTPIDYGSQASGAYPTTGLLVLNLGTPDQGTRWEVTSCAVGGLDQNVTANGSAGLYVAGYLPTTGTITNPSGLAQMADQAKTLPNVGFYGTRQLVVNDQEYLFLVIFGGTAGQTYVANASMTVFNVGSAGGKDTNVL